MAAVAALDAQGICPSMYYTPCLLLHQLHCLTTLCSANALVQQYNNTRVQYGCALISTQVAFSNVLLGASCVPYLCQLLLDGASRPLQLVHPEGRNRQ